MKTTLASGLMALTLAFGLGGTAVAQETAPAAAVELKDFSIGAPDAKVQMTEYASFTCPHCANFHDTVFKALKADYIDTGKVHFTYREVYFDRPGLWAAMIARCGGDMRYFGIHDMLFSKQAEWLASQDPVAIVDALKAIGISAGLDQASLDTCLNDQAMAEAMGKQFEANMAADGVTGTPTLFVNGAKHSNMTYEELAALIEAELAK